jgi:hypothetical protein
MADTYAISTLTTKRAKIAGLILDLEKQLADYRASLAHIDAVLKLLDPTIKLSAIRAVGRMADRSGYFAVGELSARCLDGAREAGERGVSPDDLALKAMADKGLQGDQRIRTDFICRFHWALGRLQRGGKLDKIGHGKGVRWRLRG